MSGELGADANSLRVLSEAEISQQERNAAIWASLYSYDAESRHEGAWDPEVWGQLQASDPAEVFVVDPSTQTTRLMPHVGAIGTRGLLIS